MYLILEVGISFSVRNEYRVKGIGEGKGGDISSKLNVSCFEAMATQMPQ